jgi:MFS family permease
VRPWLNTHAQSTFASLKVRNFRLYFIGQGISFIGGWQQAIAQTWLIFTLTHSGTYIGLLTATQFLPILLLGPLGGVITDRYPKRRILYVTQTASMLLAGTLAALVLTHSAQIWMVFVLAGLLGCVQVVDNPTRQTFILEMVGREHLANAITLNSIEANTSRVIGPAIAGGLIATIGTGYCFLANSVSYIAVLLCLGMMDASELHPIRRSKQLRGQLRAGFRYVRHTPAVRNVLLMMAVIGTLSYEFPVVLPVLAGKTFHDNVSGYSLLMGAMGLGAVLGGIMVAGKQKPTAGDITKAAIVFGGAMLLTAAAPNLAMATLGMAFVGMGSISFTVFANSVLQLRTRPEMSSRVMSLWTMCFVGSTPIGGPLLGYICQHAGARWGLITGGLAAVATGGLALYEAKRPELHLTTLLPEFGKE